MLQFVESVVFKRFGRYPTESESHYICSLAETHLVEDLRAHPFTSDWLHTIFSLTHQCRPNISIFLLHWSNVMNLATEQAN